MKLPLRLARGCKTGLLTGPPVIVDSAGEIVCVFGSGVVHYADAEANARAIVKAVNATATEDAAS